MSTSPQGPRPARIITPAIRQRLQELLAEARRLSRAEPCPQGEIDDLMVECVTVDPGNTVYVGAFLHHLRRSDRPHRTGFQPVLSFLSRLAGNEPLHSIRSATDAQNWEEVLTLAPRALCQQPQSVELLRQLAAACAAFEYEQAELCYLQAAAALAPDDAETHRHLARALTRQGLFDDAAVAWKRLAEMVPDDEESRQTIKILCEYELPENLKAALSEAQLEVERALNGDTSTLEGIDKLLFQLRLGQRFDDAQRLINRAAAVHGPSLTLLKWREDLALDRSLWPCLVAWKLAKLRSEYQPCVQRLNDECNRVQLQVYQQRSERHPNDVAIQFRLGQLLLRNRNYREAIKRLEPVVQIDSFRDEATPDLAEAWYGLRQSDKVEACIAGASTVGSALVVKVLDRLKECAVADADFVAARRFLDRRRECEAAGTGSNAS